MQAPTSNGTEAGAPEDGRPPVSLDDELEYLRLSNRTRNVLRRLGCTTLRSIIQRDYTRRSRGLGRTARTELASMLLANGFEPPAALLGPETDPSKVAATLLRRCDQMEADMRKWLVRVEKLRAEIVRLTGARMQ